MRTFYTKKQLLKDFDLTEVEFCELLNKNAVATVKAKHNDLTYRLYYGDDVLSYIAERDIKPEHFKHLKGKLVGINEGARKYDMHPTTISAWLSKGWLTQIDEGEGGKKLLAEEELAYLVELGRAKKIRRGKKIAP